MSKTVQEIGMIVGGIALVAIGAITENYALVYAGLGATLGGVGLALRPQIKPAGTANAISFTSGVGSRRTIYGQFAAAGVLTYASFPPSQNLSTASEFLHLVYTLTGHEITSFDAVIINGSVYNFGTDLIYKNDGLWHVKPADLGSPNDFYWEHMFFEFDFGRPTNGNQPFPGLASSDAAWTSACKQRGCAKVHVELRADAGYPALYPGGQFPNIQFLVTGKKIFDTRVVTAWQPSREYLPYNYIVDNLGFVWIQTNSFATSGTSRPNFEGAGSWPTTLTDGPLSWTGYGATITGVMTALSNNPQGNLYQQRIVNDVWLPSDVWPQHTIIEAPIGYLQFQSTASGPSSGTSEPTWAKSPGATTTDGGLTWVCLGRSPHAVNPSNSALVVADYLQDTDYGMAAPASTIDTTSVNAAANVCDEQVMIIWANDGGKTFEDLYDCNGMFDHSSNRGNVLDALCGSMAGWVVPPGDAWHVFAGAYVSPAVSLGDNDMRGPIKGDFRLSKRDAANGVDGTFIPAFLPTNPAGNLSLTQVPPIWQSASFPAYQANGLAGKPDYITEDGGQIIWQHMQLDFTTSLWMAQRLAKIHLMRLRFQETIALSCKLTALQIEPGDTFFFTHAHWGITSGVFLAESVSVVLDGNGSAPALGVDIVGRQNDPAIYEFTGPQFANDTGEYSPYGLTGIMTGVE